MATLDMRALYYVVMPVEEQSRSANEYLENMKANENNLNQNFTIITQKIAEIEARLSALESS